MLQKSGKLTSWGKGSLSHYLQGFQKHPTQVVFSPDFWTNNRDFVAPWMVVYLDFSLAVGRLKTFKGSAKRHSGRLLVVVTLPFNRGFPYETSKTFLNSGYFTRWWQLKYFFESFTYTL